MGQSTDRLVGMGLQAVAADGTAPGRMFNQAIIGRGSPVRLSFDHEPLFGFQPGQANLRILGVEAVQMVAGGSRGSSLCGTARRDGTPGIDGSSALWE
jgi:hypothetical protein